MSELVAILHQDSVTVRERNDARLADPEMSIPSEKAFSNLWERSLDLRPRVVGRDGKPYEILFPGVRNQGAGPDFKGAVLRHDGKTIGGDVELHLDSGGWRAHGHHRDSGYRGVVLQVVLKARGDENGTKTPPTAEARFERAPDGDTGRSFPNDVPDLAALGVQRFLAKSAGFMLEFESVGDPDQVAYESLLDAMGYARNRRPFRALANRVPFSTFKCLANEPSSSAEFAIVSSLVVGGGLLLNTEPFESLQMRRLARSLGIRRQVSSDAWSRFRVRPSNSPVARIRGVAPLIGRSLGAGLIENLDAAFHREEALGLIRELERPPHIGRGLAITVVANVALPALHAFSVQRGGSRTERIEKAFIAMPSPPQDAVTRGVSAVLGLDVRPKLASQHFGLHALARSNSWPGTDKVTRPGRGSSSRPRRCAASP